MEVAHARQVLEARRPSSGARLWQQVGLRLARRNADANPHVQIDRLPATRDRESEVAALVAQARN
jgi:hypothetical protein